MAEKVTFDMFQRVITVESGVTVLNVKTDVYSAWKRWMLSSTNNRIGQVVRVIGGDPTVGGQKAGDIYFLVNGWRLKIDLSQTAIIGALFSDDFTTPLIDFDGNPFNQSLVSSLVTGVDSQEIADKVKSNISEELDEISDTNTKVTNLDSKVDNVATNVTNIDSKIDDIPINVWAVTKDNITTSNSIGEFVLKQIVTLKEWYSQ